MAESQRLYRQLDALRFSSPVNEAVMDTLRQLCEKLESADRPAWKQESPSPPANLVRRIVLLAFDVRGEVPQLSDAIADREGPSGVFRIEDYFARRIL